MIRILDEKTINQIAAGEVIENPASVVKELVDNALDAGSSKIVIEIASSGRQLITVRDNGSGMTKDDALLCLERHATSKIRSIDDLWSLTTMGFRGEALSSIASISELTILTGRPGVTGELVQGTRVHARGGKILACEEVQCLPGTTFEIRSLFYNVPARKKFLKSPARDASDILKVVIQLALANPQVAFELVLNQKRELFLPSQTIQERLKETLGKEFFQELIPLEYKSEAVEITGYISKPANSRPTRVYQYLFINNRPVSSHLVSRSAKEAYGSSIAEERHPAFVLHIQMKPEILDVNVHPQKKEVRFQVDDMIKAEVIAAINQALFTSAPAPRPVSTYSSFSGSYQAPQASQTYFMPSATLEIKQEVFELPSQFQVLGVFKGFILASILWTDAQRKRLPADLSEEGIYLISSREALSRIAYEGSKKRESSVQTLLVPLFLELSLAGANCLKAHLPHLEQIGLTLREFGTNSFLIEAVPRFLEELDIEETLRALVAKLEVDGESEDLMREIASAARSSKRCYSLTVPIATHIVKKLTECDDPFISPFGLRIITIITQAEIEKKFR